MDTDRAGHLPLAWHSDCTERCLYYTISLLTGSLNVCDDSPCSLYVKVPSSVPSSISSFIPWEKRKQNLRDLTNKNDQTFTLPTC